MARLPARLALVALFAAAAGCGSKKSECAGMVCGGACVDPASFQTDANSCGGCGIRCGAGATCSAGLCQCAPGTERCDTLVPRCRDLQTDAGACGACTTSCTTTKPGSTCQAGTCQCGGTSPDDCGTFCTSWSTDPQHCGTDASACTNACFTRAVCTSGACGCPASYPDACPAGTPNECVNLDTDPFHCGACGTTCALNAICSTGTCACPASRPNPCPSPDRCVNMTTDPQDCGTCGNQCATGASCVSGSCQCPAGEALCSGSCVPCATGADCNAASGACECPAGPTPGCGGQCCVGGQTCCTGGGCQTQHSNGLGQFYYDCNGLYAPNQTTFAAAQLAALAWNPSGTLQSPLATCGDPSCVVWQTSSACAVWCFGSSTMAGRALATNTTTCAAACPFGAANPWN